MRNLWPSIEVIESNLQSGAEPLLHFPEREDAANQSEGEPEELPAFLRDKIRQRVASRAAQFDHEPKAGQVWRFDRDHERLPLLCVLLDQPQAGQFWSGWLAAAEIDYATDRDVLLEPEDEPFDPVAGMIQTWNPVSVDIRKGSRVLAQLTMRKLEAIREVAEGKFTSISLARPGSVVPIQTLSGRTVLTGTRIENVDDPRRRYQEIYRNAAEMLVNELRLGKVVTLRSSRPKIGRYVGWSLAASVMLAQAAMIASLMRSQQEAAMPETDQNNGALEYRSTPSAPVQYAFLDVYFKPDTREIDIRKLLVRLDAAIDEGPGEFGQYRIRVRGADKEAAADAFRKSGLTDAVEAR